MTKISEFGITFSVDDVEPAADRLSTSKIDLALKQLLGDGRSIESCSNYNKNCIDGVRFHPLIAAAHYAFSQHRPLVLSPDMIWVTIVQGLARHIRNNAEHFRNVFVPHQGKQSITVVRADILQGTPENDWQSVINDFSLAVRAVVGERYDNLICDFSTTTQLERTACEVALLDAFQPYFQYEVMCICGIPEITLEGTRADWSKLRGKVDLLSEYELEWWLPSVQKILDQFVAASCGNIDSNFWKNIYKQHDAYGFFNINGWLVKLIPYLENGSSGNCTFRNPLLELEDDSTELQFAPGHAAGPFSSPINTISSSSLPSGVSQAPFLLTFPLSDGQKVDMEFLGGFLGVTQNDDSGALRPELGWAVRSLTKLNQIYTQLNKFDPAPPLDANQFDRCINRILQLEGRSFAAGIPGDLISFYKICNGVNINGKFEFYPFEKVSDVEQPYAEFQASLNDNASDKWEFLPVFAVEFCRMANGHVVEIDLEELPDRNNNYGYRVYEKSLQTGGRKIVANSFEEFVEMCLKSQA